MKYTAEQLAKMSNYVIDGEIEKLRLKEVRPDATDVYFDDTEGRVFYFHDGKIKSQAVLMYCNDWSATGPLMIEYGITVSPISNYCSEHDKNMWRASTEDLTNVESWNKNVLRAICEVILMMENDK